MKKKRIALLLALFMLGTVPFGCTRDDVIGTVSGAENEFIQIGETTYLIEDLADNADTDLSAANRGEYLGRVENGQITMKVYAVKGDDSAAYIYALWDWEGAFYVRQDAP